MIAEPGHPTQASDGRTLLRVISASSVGTLIEWYDFYIFGSLATILSGTFFPKENPTAALLSTLATFAAGFVVRPFGALVFGRLGDLVGRKYTFLVTLVLMGGSTFLIGLVPGYATIGFWAPLLVLLLRLLQGLALGGEYGGAATYVAEHAPVGQRGYYTSFIQTTATLGLFLSLGVILAVRGLVGVDTFTDWGWRVPFLLSSGLVAISIYIRLNMAESPLFQQLKQSGNVSRNPLAESFGRRDNLKMVLLALFGVTAGQGVIWYTGQFYALSFLQKACNIDFVQSNYIVAVALLAATPFFVVFGRLSDRVGRKPIMLSGMLLGVLTYRLIYQTMYDLAGSGLAGSGLTRPAVDPAGGTVTLGTGAFWAMTGLVFIQVLYVTMVYGPVAAYLVELFPTRIRYTSMSLPYHIGNGVFGGLVPFVATALVESAKAAGRPDAYLQGLWYPILIAGVCFVIGLLYSRNR